MTADDTTRPDVTPAPESDPGRDVPLSPPAAASGQDSAAPAFSPQGDDAPRGSGRAAQTLTRRPIASALTVAITAGLLGLGGGYLLGAGLDDREPASAASEHREGWRERPGMDSQGHGDGAPGARGPGERGFADRGADPERP
ncbi:hypothetical protein HF995_12215 [Sanguibacter hominis ATCC BAA-789]|uniref:Uncharacterized protein n=1 Tax=Sanguibacter hominis ATCC BAA-789 TaxID=1312740 RepID=A0A9X5ISH6_9MICO|nr:hypothetical protein [Sanguibacter hominis]NKX94023.1 hypothetical protein [Sanguibacter hominis ATCC BAA-789]